MSKTHFRKVFKSDHLGVADLEDLMENGSDLIFTIKEVRQMFGVKVAGRKIDANIATFEENIKPLVVNATNSKTLKELSGGSPFVEDWSGLTVALYIDESAKLKGEVVGGVRISTKRIAKNNPLHDKIAKAETKEALEAIWKGECKEDKRYLDAINKRFKELS